MCTCEGTCEDSIIQPLSVATGRPWQGLPGDLVKHAQHPVPGGSASWGWLGVFGLGGRGPGWLRPEEEEEGVWEEKRLDERPSHYYSP